MESNSQNCRQDIVTRCSFAALSILLAVFATPAQALDAKSFLGVWHSNTVHVHVHHPDGDHAGESSVTIELTETHNGLIHGNLSWKLADDHQGLTDHAGEVTNQAKSGLAGVLNFDNISGQLLNTEDNGIFHVRLIDEDHMQAVFVEQGNNEATLYRTTFIRHRDD
ncbi:MAG: hypothetical protein ABJM29_08060 [Rhizobiaceae bacterium]